MARTPLPAGQRRRTSSIQMLPANWDRLDRLAGELGLTRSQYLERLVAAPPVEAAEAP